MKNCSRWTTGGRAFQSVVRRKVSTMEAQLATPMMCPVLIGRAQDLTTLRLLVDRSKSGQGQVALVSGEPAIGKSRLLAEIKTHPTSHALLLFPSTSFPTHHP